MLSAPNSIWTDERRKQLTMLWADGCSASVIARKMGCFEDRPDKGRSAVMGTIRRMKLPHPVGKKVRALPEPRPKSEPKPRTWFRQSKIPASDMPDGEIYGPGLQIIHLTNQNCHYPHGDPRVHGFEFCGAPALKGTPWCAYHARRIYLQPRDST